MKNEFTCAHCHKTYPKAWSDEEALKEYGENFNNAETELAVVCDDCYKRIMEFRERIVGFRDNEPNAAE